MTEKYYYSTNFKIIMAMTVVFLCLFSVISLVMHRFTSIEMPAGGIPIVVIDIVLIGVVLWRIYTPVIEISDRGLTLNLPFLFKAKSARWEEIEDMVQGQTRALGYAEPNIKLLLKAGKGTTNEMLFSLKIVEKPEEILRRLRSRIPETKSEPVTKEYTPLPPVTFQKLTYAGWTFSEEGMRNAVQSIAWPDVKNISYQGLVISGFGSTTITHIKDGGKRNLHIPSETSARYQDCIRYLLHHARNADVDPGLKKMLEYSPREARKDTVQMVSILAGISLFFIITAIIMRYAPDINSGYVYTSLLIPLGILPVVASVRSLAGRYRGKLESGSRKMLWATLSLAGPLVALLLFIALSPFSLYWLMGDVHQKTGRLDTAEGHYVKALTRKGDSIDIFYELGKVSRKRENWQEALEYLEKAYTPDPGYWGPKAVILIPDTLMQMGRYDEALQWCSRILEDRKGKVDIARAVSKMQDEIIWRKQRDKLNRT